MQHFSFEDGRPHGKLEGGLDGLTPLLANSLQENIDLTSSLHRMASWTLEWKGKQIPAQVQFMLLFQPGEP